MTRSKVKLEFIRNDSARKATFKKRKKGILKKIEELTTLCAIDACAIICSPYDDKPEVWPSPTGARQVLSRFNNLSGEDQEKRMLDQETYLKNRINKAKQQLEKIKKEEKEKELTNLLFEIVKDNGNGNIDGLNLDDTKQFCAIAQRALSFVSEAMGKNIHANEASSSSTP